ncbi:MotA/TolQ/ExbB proton channel family protein [Hirschia baltica]|uniref:MotA/TolQ/ExbB proton channel n=1 Tax=Hirschia baltica (strain ATCC 49814 / DSM 5838 / IFAM 1418) TaxID=582402 RepID=C6XI75_HIRBI|nr:MotA/TolQ/ExbB proton channel family protein [Hirschia baltica]ACT58901.1 MotA/TolQ/ExbB proton channel [Hirschia baltica ATCC 49814]
MPFFPDSLNGFLDRGGPVLFIIMAAAFVMWALILERVFYFRLSHKDVVANALEKWDSRKDHTSKYAHWVKDKIVSEVRQEAQANVVLLKAVVALAPMLGLLGTVTGMVNVFDLMAITGSSDARAMSAGVSRATIPTMAGMVISISGLLFTMDLDRKVRREVAKVEDQMEIHEDA